MRILTLIENTSATEKLTAEHGLSFYIEHAGGRYLMDTGAGGGFADNAKKMQISLYGLDAAVLSHNHYDHAGGLETLLSIDPMIQIFAKKEVLGDYSKKVGFAYIPLGKPRSFFEKYAANFVLFNSFQMVADGFFLLSNEVPDEAYASRDMRFYKKAGVKHIRDTFTHELFAVIFPTLKKEDGCVIISSCSHNGIVNIIKTVKNTWPNAPILSVIGGFHLMGSSTNKLNCSNEYIESVANELCKLSIGTIYTCHCTGLGGYQALKALLGEQLQYLQTGEELEF